MIDHDLSDAELVTRVQSGDTEAMSALYKRHRPSLYRYAYSKVYDQQLAQDIVGEIFLRVVQYLPSYKITGAPFAAWLFRIAHNTLITLAKKENKRQKLPLDYVENSATSGHQPEFAVERQLNNEWILAGLEQLDAPQKEVVILRFVVGLSLKETAHALERTVGAVKTLQHRGIHALRIVLNVKEKSIV